MKTKTIVLTVIVTAIVVGYITRRPYVVTTDAGGNRLDAKDQYVDGAIWFGAVRLPF